MIRFDVNCVMGRWPEGGATLDGAEQALAAMDRLGIGKALVRHTAAAQYDATYGNDLLMKQIAGCERLVPCWTALPLVTGEMGPLPTWLASLSEQEVRAVCLYPKRHDYPLKEWQCQALLGALAERRYLLLVERAEADAEGIRALCEGYPDLRVVMLTPGYRGTRPLYALLDSCPNLYVDLSTQATFGAIEALCARFGAERFLFGTGQPKVEGAGIVVALNYAALEEAEVRNIAAGNLERLLGEVQL